MGPNRRKSSVSLAKNHFDEEAMDAALGASTSMVRGDAFELELGADKFDALHRQTTSATSVLSSTDDVGSLRTLRDAYRLFGLKPDDRTQRREQVKMWEQVEAGMTFEIEELTSSGKVESYDKAKALGMSLELIRSEFKALQSKEVEREQLTQWGKFDKARGIVERQVTLGERDRQRGQAQTEHDARLDLGWAQQIERENLEYAEAIRTPELQRASKRVLELRRAEAGLSRLRRFDEAQTVRKMIDKLEGPERLAHAAQCLDRRVKTHSKLRVEQETQQARLRERLGEHKWASTRSGGREKARQRQRLSNLETDMRHDHGLDHMRKPELQVHPTALLERRKGYGQTASALNGQKLLDKVLGKKKGEAVFVASLCDLHDFENPLSGTELFNGTYA